MSIRWLTQGSLRQDLQQGSVLFEVVLLLPLVVTVLVLVIDLATLGLARQRTFAAIAEVGKRHALDVGPIRPSWAQVKSEIEVEMLEPRRLRSDPQHRPSASGNFAEHVLDKTPSLAILDFGGVLGSLSNTHQYSMVTQVDLPFGWYLRDRQQIVAEFWIDGSPWVHEEMPNGYLDLIENGLELPGGWR